MRIISIESEELRAGTNKIRRLAVAEAPEWTYDPVDADLPLVDPLTV